MVAAFSRCIGVIGVPPPASTFALVVVVIPLAPLVHSGSARIARLNRLRRRHARRRLQLLKLREEVIRPKNANRRRRLHTTNTLHPNDTRLVTPLLLMSLHLHLHLHRFCRVSHPRENLVDVDSLVEAVVPLPWSTRSCTAPHGRDAEAGSAAARWRATLRTSLLHVHVEFLERPAGEPRLQLQALQLLLHEEVALVG